MEQNRENIRRLRDGKVIQIPITLSSSILNWGNSLEIIELYFFEVDFPAFLVSSFRAQSKEHQLMLLSYVNFLSNFPLETKFTVGHLFFLSFNFCPAIYKGELHKGIIKAVDFNSYKVALQGGDTVVLGDTEVMVLFEMDSFSQ